MVAQFSALTEGEDLRQCSALIVVVLAAKVGDEMRALLHVAASAAAARPIFVVAVSESQMEREWLEWLVSKDVNGYLKVKENYSSRDATSSGNHQRTQLYPMPHVHHSRCLFQEARWGRPLAFVKKAK